jgi:hypothetical protein
MQLTHLQMTGYSMSFASFHVVEVMCAADFATKRVGYLAAAQSFSPTTDVLLLTTNQFKKDLTNGRMQDCSQALTCLAKLVTESLACDLSSDVAMLLSSPRPYIRKKTLLVLYRFIAVYPETLSVISEKFRRCLEDPDPSVVCAAVTVTCELARASPQDFLGLAPALYSLLTSSSNNWMLIKIVKLMGVLTPLEPRLGKKLLGPLTNLMRTTRAKSLLYECCCTVTLGLMDYPEAVELCGERLCEFTVDPDQNLKYLGLLSMRRLASAHPAVAMQHRDMILDCLDDVDIGIRMRALELVSEFVTRRTIRDITRILLRKLRSANEATSASLPSVELLHSTKDSWTLPSSELGAATVASSALLLDPETPYRDALACQLLVPGTFVPGEGYPILSSSDDFSWYIATVLGGLARTPGLSSQVCNTVASQLTELISRVEAVRPRTLAVAAELLTESATSLNLADARLGTTGSDVTAGQAQACLLDDEGSQSPSGGSEFGQVGGMEAQIHSNGTNGPAHAPKSAPRQASPPLSSAVVASAAWVLGEHAELLDNRAQTLDMLILYPVKGLSSVAQVAIISAIVKVYSCCEAESMREPYSRILSRLGESVESDSAEVSDRSMLLQELVAMTNGNDKLYALQAVFDGSLLPVDSQAQGNVPVPDGLDLDAPLLDTKGVDLYSFLSGSPSAGSFRVGSDSGDDDSLFRELEHAGSVKFGRKERGYTSLIDKTTSSPFYLGSDEPHQPERKTTPREHRFGGVGEAVNFEAGACSDDHSSVPVLLDGGVSHTAMAPTGKLKKKSKRKDATVETGAFGSAFAGLFDGPVSPGPDDLTRLKKKKKKKTRTGTSMEKTGATSDLIDLGLIENASAAAERPGGEGAKAPAHLGNQSDLLL